MCEQASNIAETFKRWGLLLARTGDKPITVAEYIEMQGLIRVHFKDFPEAARNFPIALNAPSEVLKSQLFSTDGPHMSAMIAAVHSSGVDEVQPFRDEVQEVLGQDTLKAWTAADLEPARLAALSQLAVPTETANKALGYATSIGDEFLQKHVYYLDGVLQVIKACATVECLVRARTEAQQFKDLLTTEKHGSELRNLSQCCFMLNGKFKVYGDLSARAATDAFHFKMLDEVVCMPELDAAFEVELARLQSFFRDAFSENLTRMLKTLEGHIPPYEAKSVLRCKDVCDSIIDAQHGIIASVSKAIRAELKIIKGLHADKKFVYVDSVLANRCSKTAQCAVETVSLGAVLTAILRDWPKARFKTVEECAKEVNKLKQDIAKTGWTLTAELAATVDKWEQGYFLEKEAPQPFVEPDVQPPELQQPEPLSPHPSPQASLLPTLKRSLAERARQAKRLKA